MTCWWKGTTNKGRVLLVGPNAAAPTTAASEFASCLSNGRSRRFGYPPPLVSYPDNTYSAWCLENDEEVVKIDFYNCTSINADQKYDCINGGCIPAATYTTPGKYANLAACESGCAKDAACTGECVSASEIAALKQAVSNARSRMC